jgi:hypothetical protein
MDSDVFRTIYEKTYEDSIEKESAERIIEGLTRHDVSSVSGASAK